MEMRNVLITGANEGIGTEFIRQLLARDKPPQMIFATYKIANNLEDLKSLQDSAAKTKVILIKMDVTEAEEMDVAREIIEASIGDEGIHLVIHNSEECESLPMSQITAENMEQHFKINTLGPVLLNQILYPFLEKAVSKNDGSRITILNISPPNGSISDTATQNDLTIPSYKISKAALNMAMKITAIELKEKGILVVMMCPGLTKTPSESKSEVTPEESVSNMLKTLENLNNTHQGTLMDRFGKILPF